MTPGDNDIVMLRACLEVWLWVVAGIGLFLGVRGLVRLRRLKKG